MAYTPTSKTGFSLFSRKIPLLLEIRKLTKTSKIDIITKMARIRSKMKTFFFFCCNAPVFENLIQKIEQLFFVNVLSSANKSYKANILVFLIHRGSTGSPLNFVKIFQPPPSHPVTAGKTLRAFSIMKNIFYSTG